MDHQLKQATFFRAGFAHPFPLLPSGSSLHWKNVMTYFAYVVGTAALIIPLICGLTIANHNLYDLLESVDLPLE